MRTTSPADDAVVDLLYQLLEGEQGGRSVCEAALACAADEDLHEHWSDALDQTRHHEEVLLGVFEQVGLDPNARVASRIAIATLHEALLASIRATKVSMTAAQAECVACDAVVLVRARNQRNWEFVASIVRHGRHAFADVLGAALEDVDADDDHLLQHDRAWRHALSARALGIPAALPLPDAFGNASDTFGTPRFAMNHPSTARHALRAG